ncbi:D-alanyl-D-alanine carboxypeptidase family protein [Facklamia miroungae]|uniref:D-alanyl-D-alanine carboxypeptidase (Penicillin-binding protein 5/6) n=1 Tax=Facklamia miroungae TaxID=120956 RepID=A0A1G7QHF6_9LACT|nr:serine hydrolase [Facklamia miroungae]NKZ28942.1 D-alanyl-D-alanine carboxypeptidase [Facklamia miroungae]SDF97941.1 D-alanyl-D-alanine carboxypeptidase (penicillin-binding protein 5/6) [Facklamia miroungae]
MKKEKYVKSAFLFLIFISLVNIFHPIQAVALTEYYSKSIYVYNLTENKQVFSLKANVPRKPASLVKIMTTLVALEHINNLSGYAPIDEASYYQAIEEGAAMAGYLPYESTTFRDLLYGTMLPSGAESANSLAINVAGSKKTFVKWMNEKAEDLGLNKTKFKSVDGMDQAGQVTTAKEMAMLLKEALKNGHFEAIFKRKDYLSSPTNIHPSGVYMESTVFKKLRDFNQDGFEILGGKSGTTFGAGLCWVTLAEKDEKEYIVVVLGSELNDLNDRVEGQVLDTLRILSEI